MRVKLKGCKLVTLNFSQPAGTPTNGIIQSVEEGKFLHVEMEYSVLQGYKVFGVSVNKDTARDIGCTIRGEVKAYIQFQQEIPQGITRLGTWPMDVFHSIAGNIGGGSR
jgi:hypothetical protein